MSFDFKMTSSKIMAFLLFLLLAIDNITLLVKGEMDLLVTVSTLFIGAITLLLGFKTGMQAMEKIKGKD